MNLTFKDKFIERSFQAGLFFFSAVLIALFIDPISPVSGSGDAATAWEAVIGLANGTPVASYVMYKGVMSCYPYVWLYELSQMLGVSEFFFVKLYHVLLFAYSTAIALPNIYSRLFAQRPSRFRCLLLVIILFLFWRATMALDQMMIDLPSMTCFLACVSGALNWNAMGARFSKWRVMLLFFLLGVGFCFSGQYSIATALVCIYCAVVIVRLAKEREICNMGWILTGVTSVILFALPKLGDAHFMNTIVEPLVASGGWIPDKSDWLKTGLTDGCHDYALFLPMLRSPAGSQIAEIMLNDPFISTHAGSAALPGIIRIWLQYPVEMIQLWCNRLFLAFSIDGMCRNAIYLVVGYLCLYVTILVGLRNIRNWKDLLNKDAFIYLAFLFSILISCALHMENRFAMSFQSIFLTIGILHDTVWDSIKSVRYLPRRIKDKDKSLGTINYAVIGGLVFILVCFMHYGSLMELQAIDGATDFLYTFRIW